MQSSSVSLENIQKDFPILQRTVRDGKPLVYLDNASTTQKPIQVINAISDYYTNHNANIHRAVYALAEEATEAYEATRDKIAKFLNIKNREEVIFVRGTTEGINLVAYAWGRQHIKAGDILVTTEYEHPRNIVPWQLLTKEKGAKLEYIGVDDNGELLLDQLDSYLKTGKVKLVTFSQMSNVLGTISNTEEIINKCKQAGVKTLIDGAQSVPHMKVDIEKLGCDFFGFSAAIDYLTKIGMDTIRKHEIDLTKYALEKMSQIKGITIYGSKDLLKRGGVISFNFHDVHPHDVATIVDRDGIAIRSGHHCAQVLMERLEVAATNRASFYIYNTTADVDKLIKSLEKVAELFKL